MKAYKQFASKKVLITPVLGVGILLLAIFLVSPLVSTMAQQQQQQLLGTNETILNQYKPGATINGSVNIAGNIVNFLEENTKIPFTTAAETAQQQIINGTVLGGHLGVTEGFLAYTYLVANPSDKIIHKVIIDAGNGQVLSASEGTSLESFGQLRHENFEHWKGHQGFFGGLWNSQPFGSAPWNSFDSSSDEGGIEPW
jgi:uncharacterized membrane protein YkoI